MYRSKFMQPIFMRDVGRWGVRQENDVDIGPLMWRFVGP